VCLGGQVVLFLCHKIRELIKSLFDAKTTIRPICHTLALGDFNQVGSFLLFLSYLARA
jgi:hypothetical protein